MPEKSLIEIATRHQSHLERLKAHEVGKFDRFLKELDNDIRNVLSAGKAINKKELNQQLRLIDVKMRGTMDDYESAWLESVESISAYEAGFEQRSLSNVVDGVSFSLPSDTQVAAAVHAAPLGDVGGKYSGMFLKEVIKDFSKTEIANIQKAVRIGFAEGKTTDDIIRSIRGTKKAKWKDGKLAIMKRNQDMIVRTALQHASSQAREAVWNANDSVISKVKWLSTLDKRTSSTCRSLDGTVYEIGKGRRPPAHIRCRSTTIAVLDNKYAALSKGRTRVMRDPNTGKISKVSADQTYYGWLKTQPAKVQDSIIGKSRGRLLRDGGLSSERFAELNIGKLDNPLTLDEMRNIEPLAFEKAGL